VGVLGYSRRAEAGELEYSRRAESRSGCARRACMGRPSRRPRPAAGRPGRAPGRPHAVRTPVAAEPTLARATRAVFTCAHTRAQAHTHLRAERREEHVGRPEQPHARAPAHAPPPHTRSRRRAADPHALERARSRASMRADACWRRTRTGCAPRRRPPHRARAPPPAHRRATAPT
jgi:hypothetical protein